MEIQQLSWMTLYSTTTSLHKPKPKPKPKPTNYSKTHFTKPSKNPNLILPPHPHYTALPPFPHYTNPSPSLPSKSRPFHNYNQHPPHKSIKHNTTFVEKYILPQNVKSLIEKLRTGNLSPLHLLQDDGDWDKTQFWAVVKFLQQNSRFDEIPEVFNAWMKLEQSRIRDINYTKIIGLLSEAGMIDEAASKLQEMKSYGLQLCLEVYNPIIQGYVEKGKFDDVLCYINEMKEANISPDKETYEGLIKAYGKFQMYDEMMGCLKTMVQGGCLPDHNTYNLLICELSKGGLLGKMESVYHALLSKKMDIQSSTLVAMVEAYADFRVLGKMEKFYLKVAKLRTSLNRKLVRKVARVFIENHMFSRLDDLANDLASKTGRTGLFWQLRLLSHACHLSKKGMNSVIQQMEEAEVTWSATFANIVLMACLKMKDFEQLNILFSDFPSRNLEPDIVTFGILYDAHSVGYDWSRILKAWRRYGYLENDVEMNTDPLVFTAFGKGIFLETVEEMHSLLEPKTREEKRWTYSSLVDLVNKHLGYLPKPDETAQICNLHECK